MNGITAIVRDVSAITDGRVLVGAPLSRFASFRIGGPADLLAEPRTTDELSKLLCYAREESIPYFLLGAGSNVLFHDNGFRGLVVRTTGLNDFRVRRTIGPKAYVSVSAGAPLPLVVRRLNRLGFSGLEWLWGIPASFGGAVACNAGASGWNIADILTEIRTVSPEGEECTLTPDQLKHGYRFMDLPTGSVVVQGALELQRRDWKDIEAAINRARMLRKTTQPLDRPSAGCVFKNPSPDNPAGAIIDRLGFKSRQIGDAQVSPVHANFIVNQGQAKAADVLELIDVIRERVKAEEGLDLELEIRVVGEEQTDVDCRSIEELSS
jgi:UDP-N-acetylmuramate dehydrogenase